MATPLLVAGSRDSMLLSLPPSDVSYGGGTHARLFYLRLCVVITRTSSWKSLRTYDRRWCPLSLVRVSGSEGLGSLCPVAGVLLLLPPLTLVPCCGSRQRNVVRLPSDVALGRLTLLVALLRQCGRGNARGRPSLHVALPHLCGSCDVRGRL